MDIIQSETNRGKKSINFNDHTYRLSNVLKMETSRTDVPKKKLQIWDEVRKKRRIFFWRSMVCTLEAKFPDKNTSWQLVASFVPEQTCNFYEYFSDFMIVYNKWTCPVLLWCKYRILPKL